jgi:hypothetical protein
MATIDHNKKHDLDSTSDHTSTVTTGNLYKADANSLPEDAGVAASNVKKHNFSATAAPTKDDDTGDGYEVGSMWWYPDARKLFICYDATSTDAVWKMVANNHLVYNSTGSEISLGEVVYINGATGVNPTVALAKADAEATSALTYGLMLEDTANNDFGYVVTTGVLTGVGGSPLDTSGISAGAAVYLSAATAGAFTGTAPTSPNHLTIIGKCIVSNAVTGSIFVDVLNGFETTELHDVSETAADTNGDVMAWDNSASIYKATEIRSTDSHLTVGYTVGTPSIDLTVVQEIKYAPTGIEFGNATQNYDVTGTTWVNAVAGGTLGGIPDETSTGHKLADCLAAVATARDGSYLNVREAAGAASATNPNTVHFLFTSVDAFDTICVLSKYNGGAAHVMAIELYDYVNTAYVRIATFTDQTFYNDYYIRVHGASNFLGTGGDAGKVILQLIHDNAGNTAHSIEFEYVKVCDTGAE